MNHIITLVWKMVRINGLLLRHKLLIGLQLEPPIFYKATTGRGKVWELAPTFSSKFKPMDCCNFEWISAPHTKIFIKMSNIWKTLICLYAWIREILNLCRKWAKNNWPRIICSKQTTRDKLHKRTKLNYSENHIKCQWTEEFKQEIHLLEMTIL